MSNLDFNKVNNTAGASSSTVTSSSTYVAGGVTGGAIPVVKKLTNEELSQKLGIPLDKLLEISVAHPGFENLSFEDQQKIVNKALGTTPSETPVAETASVPETSQVPANPRSMDTLKVVEPSKSLIATAQTSDGGIHGAVNNANQPISETKSLREATIQEAQQMVLEEFAKNQYIQVEGNSEKAWNNLSPQERSNYVNKVVEGLKEKNPNFEKLLQKAQEAQGDKERTKEVKQSLDKMRVSIQAANDIGMSFEDFSALPKEEQEDIRYCFAKNKLEKNHENRKALSFEERRVLDRNDLKVEALKYYYEKNNIPSEEIELARISETYDKKELNEAQLVLDYLNHKEEVDGGLSRNHREIKKEYALLAENAEHAQEHYEELKNVELAEDNLYETLLYKNDFTNNDGTTDYEKRAKHLVRDIRKEARTLAGDNDQAYANYLMDAFIAAKKEGDEITANELHKVLHSDKNGKDLTPYIEQYKQDRGVGTVMDTHGVAHIDEAEDASRVTSTIGTGNRRIDEILGYAAVKRSAEEQKVDVAKGFAANTNSYMQILINDTAYSSKNSDTQLEIARIGESTGNPDVRQDAINRRGLNNADVQLDIQDILLQNGTAEDFALAASTGSTLAAENQVQGGKNVVEGARERGFSQEQLANIELNVANDIVNYAKENQVEMHDYMSVSEFESVQRQLGQNISKYHEDNQAEAYRITMKYGNEAAIEEAVAGYDKMAESAQVSVQSEQRVASAAVEAKTVNNTSEAYAKSEGPIKYADLTEQEAIERAKEDFMNASPSQKYDRIATMIDKGMRQGLLEQLVKYCPSLLTSMMDTLVSNGQGQAILNMLGKSSAVTYKVINVMMAHGSNTDKKVAAEYVMEYEDQFSEPTVERAQEILAIEKGIDISSNRDLTVVTNTISPNGRVDLDKIKPGSEFFALG